MPNSDLPFFLDGALQIAQGAGYRAGMDAALLAAAMQVPLSKHALELGCGVGTALLCAAWRNPNAVFTGVEKQTELAELAANNAARNQMNERVDIHPISISNLAAHFKPDHFDQVFFNPPFQDHKTQGNLPKPGKDTAFIADDADLAFWVRQAVIFVKARGYITVIHRADRLAQLVALLHGSCADIRVQPIAPRVGNPAHRVLVRARKGVRSPSKLLPPLILHQADQQYTRQADAIFRGKQALVF